MIFNVIDDTPKPDRNTSEQTKKVIKEILNSRVTEVDLKVLRKKLFYTIKVSVEHLHLELNEEDEILVITKL